MKEGKKREILYYIGLVVMWSSILTHYLWGVFWLVFFAGLVLSLPQIIEDIIRIMKFFGG